MIEEVQKPKIEIGGSWTERHFRRGIGAKVTMLVLGLVVIFLIVGAIVFMGLRQTATGIAKVQELFDTAEKVTSLSVQTNELENGVAAIMQRPEDAAFEPLFANIASQKEKLAEIRTALASQAQAAAEVERMIALLDDCDYLLRRELEPAVAARDSEGMAAVEEKIHSLHTQQMEGAVVLLVATQKEILVRRDKNISMLGRSRLALEVGILIAVVGGLTAGFLVSGRISRRLKRLGGGVDEIRQGNLAHRVEVTGNDEVSDLSRSFNIMASALEDRTGELQREQNHIRSVHQGIADGIIVFDRVGRVVSANAAAEVATGRSEAELAGKWNMGINEIEEMVSMPELVPDDAKVRCRELLSCRQEECPAYAGDETRCWLVVGTLCQNAAQGGFARKRHLCERCPAFLRNSIRMTGFSRSERHYSVSGSPILDDQGAEQGRLAVIHDVTELRAAELATLKRNRELALLNEISTYIGRAVGDLERVFDETLQAVLQAMDASTGAVLLVGPDGLHMDIKAREGFSPELGRSLHDVVLSSDILELTDEEGAFLDIDALFASQPELSRIVERESLKQPLVAILWGEDGAIGLLAIADERKSNYAEDERQLLRAVAAQLGVAVRNIELIGGIKKAKKEWEVTFDAMTDGVAILDRELNIIRANYSMAEMLGISMPDIIGRKGYEIFTPDTATDILGHQQSVIEKGRQATIEVAADGSGRILRLAFDPVVDAGGRVVGLVNIASDITEQRQLREQLLQSEKMAAIGQLVAGVAHELNNPLTGIMGYAELLLRRGAVSNGEAGNDLLAIRGEAERASRIVSNLLSFARKQPAQKSHVSINEAVDTVVELRQYELKMNNIRIEMDLDEKLPKTSADLHQIEQVLLNIINNAEQAIMESGSAGTIRISTAATGRNILMIIEDDGPGIAAEVISQIFNPFFTTKEVGKGTGLGLSICYGIIKDHGGDIRVESDGERGARFMIEIPVSQPAVALVPEPAEGKARDELARRVLVVDDEPAIAELLCDILTMEGHGVDVVDNGLAALTKLSKVKYDSVITDIKMPEMDGKELHQRICSLDPDLAERVIFITGDTVSAETRRYLNQTGNLCLMKPFNLEELRMKLQRMLSRNGN